MTRCFGSKVGRPTEVSENSSGFSPGRSSVKKGKADRTSTAKGYGPLLDSGRPSLEYQRSRSLEQSPRRRGVPVGRRNEASVRETTLTLPGGDVINHSRDHSTKNNKAMNDPHSSLGIFRAQVDGGKGNVVHHPPLLQSPIVGNGTSRSAQSSGHSNRERVTPAIEPAGSQEYLGDHSLPHSDPLARYAQKGSLVVDLPRDRQAKKDPIPQSRSFLTRMVIGKENNEDEKDRLSDVPSDVDSVDKDRYILACQMLKSAVTEKERALQPLEKEFILSLLGNSEDSMTLQDNDTSIRSQNQSSAARRTPLHAEGVFRNQQKGLAPASLTAGNLQRQVQFNRFTPAPYQRQDISSKHPHTATRAKPKAEPGLMAFVCSPNSLSDEESESDGVLLLADGNDDDGSSVLYEAGEMPSIGNRLVRFNGWNFYKPAECPFLILGRFDPQLPRVLTPFIMENLRGFFPVGTGESNFWLKFSLVRDAASLLLLLDSIQNSPYTVIAVETKDGEVFGSFTSTRWRTGTRWFGSGDAFLWRLKKSRYTAARTFANYENEMEVYPCTGADELIQYCTHKTIAVGGGEWEGNTCPFRGEPRGIGFMIDGDLVGGETNSCATFGNPRLCKNTSASNEFSIANVEVWTLTPCMNLHDASNMEIEGMFLGSTQASF